MGNRIAAGAVILCGGQSTRMGRPKALLPWRGRTLIEHVVSVIQEVTSQIVVVNSAELEIPPLPADVVCDRSPGLGPLAGIREGLEAVQAELAYVTSTDAPFLTPAFVRAVLSFGTAAAPEVDGYVQTLSAAYPKRLAETAGRLIEDGRRRPLHLLETAGYRKIREEELPDLESLHNLNTPEAYLGALRRAADLAPAHLEFLGTAHGRAGVDEVEIEPGHLGEVLRAADARFPSLGLQEGDGVASQFLISLNGRAFVRNPRMVVAPGDRIIVLDAAAGG